ncbi:MAG: 2-oxo acid dehydrogenase subunit E2 [Chloroflexi bacterium]|nr:2-oxo acid dehydrogenase subunit E2 [Chloroflexota bacterium]
MAPAGYQIRNFSRSRHGAVALLRLTEHHHTIHGLIEADVTAARQYIRDHEARTGEQLSFTAFIIACLGKAVSEDKFVQAYRWGRRRLIVFDDVDVTTMVERTVDDEKTVLSTVIRAADKKPYADINREIWEAQQRPAANVLSPRLKILYDIVLQLPWFIQKRIWNYLMSDPRRGVKYGGTVAVTAVGMFGDGGGWGIPLIPNTLTVTLGGIAQKPGIVDGRIEPREFLSLTLSFDHDIVDGAPAARFASRFKHYIECGYGLLENTEP